MSSLSAEALGDPRIYEDASPARTATLAQKIKGRSPDPAEANSSFRAGRRCVTRVACGGIRDPERLSAVATYTTGRQRPTISRRRRNRQFPASKPSMHVRARSASTCIPRVTAHTCKREINSSTPFRLCPTRTRDFIAPW